MGRISQKLEMKKKNEHRKENAYDKHKKLTGYYRGEQKNRHKRKKREMISNNREKGGKAKNPKKQENPSEK